MKFDVITSNIAHTIRDRRKHAGRQQVSFPVTFTHNKKEATGCLIFVVEKDGQYQAKKFSERYMNIDDPAVHVYHGAYYECDDDLDRRDELIDVIAGKL
ncbi:MULTISPECIES: hypothetical protein [Loigolactobacillus]|uniref:Uncharacterized protein n=1 Tax=Loigolactobacillus backii TaxID=375175 RepID=A0A192H4F9_9LACO|nr:MULTISPECIES: hypothetical protein [Loigolactobacillus]ANK59924.1 hypothetical protein AYR52_06405 [Loigolactobacillus backii]ANK63260.1 hypothetical protein AYR53_11070 [Loigolactobacillus backii]ANK64858.1 hypothetical protein AYR54_06085 [Loigolactobacillus backii]ANK66695.1 hypothetical protein AYR55_02670 [Loigolactobacillus backii]ANK69734.1 hypothetical protein AYR56_05935 [Loigolactobacillus backii]